MIKQETITVLKEEFEDLKRKAEKLKKLEAIDFDLIRQFASSLEDLKEGRFKRLA